MKKQVAILIASIAAVAAMCMFIFSMSEQPAGDSGAISLEFAEPIARILVPSFDSLGELEKKQLLGPIDHVVRKTAHFTEYAVLGALVFNALVQISVFQRNLARRRSSSAQGGGPLEGHLIARHMLTAWVLSTLYAASDEIHQLFVDGRGGMLSDVAVDSAGVATGVIVCMLVIGALWRRRSNQRSVLQ